MKHYKYWIKEKFEIKIDGKPEEISLLIGSNVSKTAAHEEAKSIAGNIERRIVGNAPKEDYEVAIKEYVSEVIDDSNLVTICRYGAKILNTDQYTILDLDDYPTDFLDRFKSVRKMGKKDRIVFKFEERIKKNPELGSDFRIYETSNGIRVIGKKYLSPSEEKNSSLLKKFGVDSLYVRISRKQNCYRARLTPKPHRMRFKTIKIRTPVDCESAEYMNWSNEYEKRSAQYSVVRLIKCIGRDFSNDRVIQFHDRVCNANLHKTLA